MQKHENLSTGIRFQMCPRLTGFKFCLVQSTESSYSDGTVTAGQNSAAAMIKNPPWLPNASGSKILHPRKQRQKRSTWGPEVLSCTAGPGSPQPMGDDKIYEKGARQLRRTLINGPDPTSQAGQSYCACTAGRGHLCQRHRIGCRRSPVRTPPLLHRWRPWCEVGCCSHSRGKKAAANRPAPSGLECLEEAKLLLSLASATVCAGVTSVMDISVLLF